jgi:hypothetical protein
MFSVEQLEAAIGTAHMTDLVDFRSHHDSNKTQTFESSSRPPASPRAIQATVAYDLKFSNAQLTNPITSTSSSS